MILISLFELETSLNFIGTDSRAISKIVKNWPNSKRSPPRFFYFAWFSRIEWWFVFVGAPEVIINEEKWGYTMIFCVAPKLIPPGPGGFWTLKKIFNEIVVLAVPWTKIPYSNEMFLDFYTKWAFLSILCFIQLLNYMY